MESWTTRTELIMLGRLVLAALLAGLVGYEREQAEKPAGFRTHILVGMGRRCSPWCPSTGLAVGATPPGWPPRS